MSGVEGRVPANDAAAEAAVLSACLLSREALDEAADELRPEQCYVEANRRIWEAMLELAADGKPVDLVTVAGRLRDRGRLQQIGGAEYLAGLADAVPAVSNLGAYVRRVVEKARVRQMVATCQRVAAEGYGDVGNVPTWLDASEQSVFDVAKDAGDGREVAPLSEALRENLARIEAAHRAPGKHEISTGLTRLDQKLGGLDRDCLTVIAARPSMGKSAQVGGLATHVAASGLGVVFFSLEMGRSSIAGRLACGRAGIDVAAARQGFMRPNQWAQLALANDYLAKLPMWIDDRPACTLMHVRAKARRVAARVPLGLVVVDYLQLMTGSQRKGESREREIASLSGGLKQLAMEMHVHVIAVSQLSREVEQHGDKRPSLRHLRESGAIEQDADNVLFLHRQEYFLREKCPPDERGIAEVIVAKQRNGPIGTVKVRFDGPTMTFSDLPMGQSEEDA